ncbi:hypothetical protein BH09PSE1_BH09PSE1_03640 [soil metagenome]
MLLMSLMAALAVAQPASGAPTPTPTPSATATQVQPRELRLTFDGRTWSCDTTGLCGASGPGTSQPILRECRRLVARVGAVSAFSRDDVALDAAQLALCNASAR